MGEEKETDICGQRHLWAGTFVGRDICGQGQNAGVDMIGSEFIKSVIIPCNFHDFHLFFSAMKALIIN